MRISRCVWSTLLIIALCAFAGSAAAGNADQRFCIVPVKDAAAGIGHTGQVVWKTNAAFRLPGIAAPVFVALFGKDWTIDANRRAVPYDGPNAPGLLGPGAPAIPPRSGRFINSSTFESQILHRTLTYQAGFFTGSRWRQTTSDRLVDIPGGDIRMPGTSKGSPSGYVRDLTALGQTLIQGADGFYLFNGTKIEPVRDGGRQTYGDYLRVYDLPAIGRVLVVTQKGVFELTSEGALAARPMPFPTDLSFKPSFADWPTAKMALVATQAGIFVLDRNLQATPILGDDQVEDVATLGEIEGSGDMVLSGRRGVFVAVDGQHAGPETCEHARRLHDAIPESTLCLRPIPGTDEHAIGFAIGGMIEAPGNKGLLLDTVAGLFLQKPDGSVVNLQPRVGQYTRDLVRLPWSDEVLAAGFDAAVVHADLLVESLGQWIRHVDVLPSLEAVLIASDDFHRQNFFLKRSGGTYHLQKTTLPQVQGVFDAPWLGKAFVWTDKGLFTLDGDDNASPFEFAKEGAPSPARYRLNDFDANSVGVSVMFGIDRLQQVLVRGQNGWGRITPDLRWLPMRSMPNELVLAHFDPGTGNAVFFGTMSGVYAVDANGKEEKLDIAVARTGAVRDFARAGDGVIAGGSGGLYEISSPSSIAPVENGDSEHIGSVFDIADAEFAGFDIVTASNGTFAYEAGRLSRISDLSAVGGASKPSVFPQLRRVIAINHSVKGPLLFDLLRRSSSGECNAPLVEVP